jgi:hypothetical protein
VALSRFFLRSIVVAIAMSARGYVGHPLLLGLDFAAIEPRHAQHVRHDGALALALISAVSFPGHGMGCRGWAMTKIHCRLIPAPGGYRAQNDVLPRVVTTLSSQH